MEFLFYKTNFNLLGILKLCESLNKSLSYVNREWTLNIEDNLEQIYTEAINEFEDEKKKLIQYKKKCIIFGRTFAGKSSFVNAILGSSILPMGNGITSTGYVTIKKSLFERSYVVINNEDEDIDILQELNNSEPPSIYHAELFYDKSKWLFSCDTMEIIDTPGINEAKTIDENVKKYCEDAHLVILIVDSSSSFDITLKKFVSAIQRTYLQLHIFIVFNKWDMMNDHEIAKVRSQHFTSAREVLCTTLEYSNEDANKRIFFLSSAQQLKKSTGNQNKTFEDFMKDFEKEIENILRKISFMRETYDWIWEKIKPLSEMMRKMNEKKEVFENSSNEKIKKAKSVEKKILKIISEICDQSYQHLNDELLKEIEFSIFKATITQEDVNRIAEEVRSQQEENKSDEIYRSNFDFILPFVDDRIFENIPLLAQYHENTTEQLSQDEKKELLLVLIQKLLTKTIFEEIIDKLNTQFKELVNDQNDAHMICQLGQFKVEYNTQGNEQSIFSFAEIFLENILNIWAENITTKIKLFAGIGTAVSMGAVAATGGVLGAVIAPIEFGIAAYIGIGVGAAAGGAVVGGGIALAIVHFVRIDWKRRLVKSEAVAKNKWEKFQNQLVEEYKKLFDDYSHEVMNMLDDLQDRLNAIKLYLGIVNLDINIVDNMISG